MVVNIEEQIDALIAQAEDLKALVDLSTDRINELKCIDGLVKDLRAGDIIKLAGNSMGAFDALYVIVQMYAEDKSLVSFAAVLSAMADLIDAVRRGE